VSGKKGLGSSHSGRIRTTPRTPAAIAAGSPALDNDGDRFDDSPHLDRLSQRHVSAADNRPSAETAASDPGQMGPPAIGPTDDARSSAAAGRLWVLAAAVMWSSSGLFAKAPIFDHWPVEQRGLLLAFWRALFAGLLLLPVVRRPKWDVKLVPLCIAFTIMNVSYLSAMTLTTAANAIWLQSTAPWWVFLVGVLVLREPFVRSERFPLVIGGAGLAIILWFQASGQGGAGILFGLVSGLAYSGVVMSLRALRSHDAVWLVVVCHLAAATALSPYVAYVNVWPSGWQVLVLAGFGLFQMALPYVFFARGLRSITSQEATGIGLVEPLLLPLWVFLAWDEVPAPSTLFGGALIFAGLVLRYAVPMMRGRSARVPSAGGR
jgi:DME family drug/metabolite transporter